jgi:hypothetical protein
MLHLIRGYSETAHRVQSLIGSGKKEDRYLEKSKPVAVLLGIVTHRGAFGAFMLAAFGLGVLPVFLGLLNADDTWLLHAAARVLAGETLYVDVVETNPPLIVWLNFLPILLARAMGISEVLGLRLIVLGLIAGSLLLTRWTLSRVLPDRPASRRFLLVLSLFTLLPLTGYDFGEREHLLLAMILPYLLMASGRAMDRPMDGVMPWVVGTLAGIGILLKPHFVPLWLAVEAYVAQVRRDWRVWLRPEALIVAALGITYAIAIVAITPDYLKLVMWARSVYSDSSVASISSLISEPGALVSMMAWLGFLFVRPRGSYRRCCEVILIANLGLLSAAFIQYRGYRYHFYPSLASAMLLMGLLALESGGLDTIRSKLAGVVCGGLVATLMVQATIDRVYETQQWRERQDSPDSPLVRMIHLAKDYAKDGSIFTFSPSLVNGFPLVTYSGVGWASRHPCIWFLPALYAKDFHKTALEYHPIEAMGDTERFLFESVVDDLLKNRPLLLFVDESEPKLVFKRKHFDYLDYYSQDPRFAAFLRQYEPLTRVDAFRAYRRKASTRLTTRP